MAEKAPAKPCGTFAKHDRVVIQGGPLCGIVGSIVSVERKKCRAKISVPFADNFFSLRVAFAEIKKNGGAV